jgi:hypothetical protein
MGFEYQRAMFRQFFLNLGMLLYPRKQTLRKTNFLLQPWLKKVILPTGTSNCYMQHLSIKLEG